MGKNVWVGADGLVGCVNPIHWFFIYLSSCSPFCCCVHAKVQLFVFQTSNPSTSVWKSIIYRVRRVTGAKERGDSAYRVPGVRWQQTGDSGVPQSCPRFDATVTGQNQETGHGEKIKFKKKILLGTEKSGVSIKFIWTCLKKKAKPGMHRQTVGLKF